MSTSEIQVGDWFRIREGKSMQLDRAAGYEEGVPYRVARIDRFGSVKAEGKESKYEILPDQYERCDPPVATQKPDPVDTSFVPGRYVFAHRDSPEGFFFKNDRLYVVHKFANDELLCCHAPGGERFFVHPWEYRTKFESASGKVFRFAIRLGIPGFLLGSAGSYALARSVPYVRPLFASLSQLFGGLKMNQFVNDPLVYDAIRFGTVGTIGLAFLGLLSFTFRKAITSPALRWTREAREIKGQRLTAQQRTQVQQLRDALAPLVETIQPAISSRAVAYGSRADAPVNAEIKAGDVVEVVKNVVDAHRPSDPRKLLEAGERVRVKCVRGTSVVYECLNGKNEENALPISDVRKIA